MSMRFLGGFNKPTYNPLASNVTTGVNVVQYQGEFTLAQQGQALTSQQWVTDPNFKQTTLLLQADGTVNGLQNNSFLDSSTANAGSGWPITRNGNTTQGAFTPFSQSAGWWSNYFSDGQNNYIYSPSNVPAITGDYTAEAWVYITSLPNIGAIFALNGSQFELWVNTNGTVVYYTPSSNRITTSLTISLNTWTHVALVRSSGVAKIYINGVADAATYTSSATIGSGTALLYLARDVGVSAGFNGYISNARLAVGAAVYTSNFTPPTVPLGATTGGQNPPTGTQTYLLTCQSNRFIDNSGNTNTPIIVGTPSVQAFSPFAPQYQWTPTVIGGSSYMAASGDYLQLPANTAFAPGTGDFTVDGWIYSGSNTLQTIWAQTVSGTNYFVVEANYPSSVVQITTTASGGGTAITSAATLKLNQWNYFTISRTSGTITVWCNGSAGTPTANANNLTNTTYIPTIGTYSHSTTTNVLIGYLCNLRYINGTALSGTTIPTSLNTAVTNTKALLNFTNAGIYDGTMKNDLQTVGNAQVSTAVVKYGSGSMYFDGTGDWLSIPSTPPLYLSNYPFTIEAWVYPLTTTSGSIIARRSSVTSRGFVFSYGGFTASKFSFYCGDTNTTAWEVTIDSSNTYVPNQWYHVAVTRNSLNVFTLWVNGISAGTATNSVIIADDTSTLYVGGNDATGSFNGYIDDLRVTKGVGRYTANFKPPQVALPRQ